MAPPVATAPSTPSISSHPHPTSSLILEPSANLTPPHPPAFPSNLGSRVRKTHWPSIQSSHATRLSIRVDYTNGRRREFDAKEMSVTDVGSFRPLARTIADEHLSCRRLCTQFSWDPRRSRHLSVLFPSFPSTHFSLTVFTSRRTSTLSVKASRHLPATSFLS